MKSFLGYLIMGFGLGVFKAVESSWLVGVSLALVGIGLHLVIEDRIEEAKHEIMDEIEELEK